MPMTFSLIRRTFQTRNDESLGCTLVDKLAFLGQSSENLNVALRQAADEIGRTLGLERAAILLQQDCGMRLAGDYCKDSIGPTQREKLRQLDLNLTGTLNGRTSISDITDAGSDPRLHKRLAP